VSIAVADRFDSSGFTMARTNLTSPNQDSGNSFVLSFFCWNSFCSFITCIKFGPSKATMGHMICGLWWAKIMKTRFTCFFHKIVIWSLSTSHVNTTKIQTESGYLNRDPLSVQIFEQEVDIFIFTEIFEQRVDIWTEIFE
jgi:hypothetical protein